MKKILLLLFTILLAFALCACNNNSAQDAGNDVSQTAEADSGADAGKQDKTAARISIDTSENDTSTYKDHVADLWEQTKVLLKEDLDGGYSDEEYQDLGNEIDIAWTDLQVHASVDHADQVEAAAADVKYANLIGDIKLLIDREYGNWDAGTPEDREKERESLRDGGLDRKTEALDKIVYSNE